LLDKWLISEINIRWLDTDSIFIYGYKERMAIVLIIHLEMALERLLQTVARYPLPHHYRPEGRAEYVPYGHGKGPVR
jgi:hypothetical protein